MRFLSSVRSRLRVSASVSVIFALTAPFVLGCGGGATPGPDAPAPSISGDESPVEEASDDAESPAVDAPAADDSGEPIRRIVDGKGYDLSVDREIPNLRAGDARATVGVPAKWVLPTRRPEYVIWFAEKLGQEFPRILVSSEPAPVGMPDTTEANVKDLEAQVASRVTDALEPPKALIIGGVPCVRYVTAAKGRDGDLEEQILETVQGGQLFKINLQAPVATAGESPLPKYRDKGYAVLASLKVEKAEPSPETAEPPPADATPAPDAAAPDSSEGAPPAN